MAFMMPVIKNNYEIVPKAPKQTSASSGTKIKSHSMTAPRNGSRPTMVRQYSKSFSSVPTQRMEIVQVREMSDLNAERLAALRKSAFTTEALTTPLTSATKRQETVSSKKPETTATEPKGNTWSLAMFRRRKSISVKTVR